MKLIETKLKLLNGVEIPLIGLGTYKLTDETETYQTVLTALQNGYRHIDTAQYYGNETIIGKAIKDSGVPRNEIFITSKIWNANHKYDAALQEVDNILQRLDIDYLDLCLIHWPTVDRNECFRALETAYKAKKIRAIGVSNFEVSHLQELMTISEVKPMVNQIELHPGLNNTAVVEFCQQNGIIVESWATLMQGKCVTNPTILKIAEKHQKSPAQVCLKWAVQQNIVVIPKSTHKERLIANTQLDDFMLDEADMATLFALPQERLGSDPNYVDF
ncbi:aldo/keto reductase [Spiroplasma poulsonii]|uniref:Aldo/keto reductase n=1 Tax=Spiroplasma poulsonii TaxID=2138 RepID=A0A3S0TWH1_9MOLU|nr:aldo/keto reductase [Spiroplasma poulsonii]MBW3059111.1 aldo/keto reductase [Spiroplasma poulsonii]RUP75265.1 aldo/keto reductase [Spiroplasma poulsonii]